MTTNALATETMEGRRRLQEVAWSISESKGFHDDEPRPDQFDDGVDGDAAFETAIQTYAGNRLMLIVSEVAKAHEELRKGNAPDFIYYPEADRLSESGGDPAEARGPFKPEGIPSEIADVVIRCFDFAGAHGIDLATIIDEKLVYNTSRPFKHGKKF